MRVLALEPFFDGSHRAFLEGWSSTSRHHWTVLGLPAHNWKWRMRHAPVTLARDVNERASSGEKWDCLFCSDMLSLAEFKGLVDPAVGRLPSVVYFHENQLTYPNRHEQEWDFHFGFTNIISAFTADQVWFSSAFHRDSFLSTVPGFLRRMPDHRDLVNEKSLRAKSFVFPQGIRRMPARPARKPGPARILWAARWEHDKNPELFFDALRKLIRRGFDYRVSVIGEQFSETPPEFDAAKLELGDRIDRWGYQESRAAYEQALVESDIIVSTADHEFFGVSAVEAIAAGVYPLLPRRLAYPEILDVESDPGTADFYYDGSLSDLVERLSVLLDRANDNKLWGDDSLRAVRKVECFYWDNLTPKLDSALEAVRSSR